MRRSASILDVEIDEAAVQMLASRGRGTPRVINRLLRRTRDHAEVKGDGRITEAQASAAMEALDIDDIGLDTTDRRLLAAIVQKFGSGPVGGAAIAAVIGESVETVEDVYEPYLLQLGFLDRTPQGRVATELAREHLRQLGYEVPPPRRAEREDPGLWDGVTSEGRDRSGEPGVTRRPCTASAPLTASRCGPRPGQALRLPTGAPGPGPGRAAGRGLRLPRTQRRGQDHADASAGRPHPPRRRTRSRSSASPTTGVSESDSTTSAPSSSRRSSTTISRAVTTCAPWPPPVPRSPTPASTRCSRSSASPSADETRPVATRWA